MTRRISLVTLTLWLVAAVVLGAMILGSILTLAEGRFTVTQWRDLIINGLALGAVYALIALGYTLVYGILFMINFAHGEVFMAGAFTAYFAADALSDAGLIDSNPIVALAMIFAVAMLTSMVIAVLLERIAYRRLRNAPRLVPLITAIGASLFLQYAFRGLYGSGVRSYPNVPLLDGTYDIFGIPVRATQAMVILSAIALMIALWFLINRTRTGRAMRAVSEDRETAALMGIDVNATIVRTFAIGGLLAGAAGVLYALIFSQVFFAMGFIPGIKAFTAAVLGGIGNIAGAMIGGFGLGILEQVGPNLFLSGYGVPGANQLRDGIAFAVLVIVLIIRPTGILGRKES
ncbi:MAG: branched-chain amino acid ABC transporter permease [Chloroflexota bacterium]|jgi:branched-chain amino acid transport system permease protein|nr:branched-chain amino acid ABC transporter permease [Chloroflexota bacterium]